MTANWEGEATRGSVSRANGSGSDELGGSSTRGGCDGGGSSGLSLRSAVVYESTSTLEMYYGTRMRRKPSREGKGSGGGAIDGGLLLDPAIEAAITRALAE